MSGTKRRKFEWISTQAQWDSAIEAFLLCDLPMAIDLGEPEGGEYRYTVTKLDDSAGIGIDVVREQRRYATDARGCVVWELRDSSQFFVAHSDGLMHGLATTERRAMLSLVVRAASANYTDDDGKPCTVDGVATVETIDDWPADVIANFVAAANPDGYCWGARDTFVGLYDDDFRCVAKVTRGDDESHPWVYMLPDTVPSHGFDDIRNAMDAAERAAIDNAESRDAESSEPAIEVVDVTPTKSHEARQAKCVEMILKVSVDALKDIETHLAAIVEVEAGE